MIDRCPPQSTDRAIYSATHQRSTRGRRVSRATIATFIGASIVAGCTDTPAARGQDGDVETSAVASSQAELLHMVNQDSNGMITARDQGARFPGGKFVAKETLKIMSRQIRNMDGKQFKKVFRFLDDDSASKLLKHSDEVANAVDDLVRYLDKPQAVLREVLYNRLAKFLPPSQAEDIASAIAGVVSNALL